jgi:hypothetical protein
MHRSACTQFVLSFSCSQLGQWVSRNGNGFAGAVHVVDVLFAENGEDSGSRKNAFTAGCHATKEAPV